MAQPRTNRRLTKWVINLPSQAPRVGCSANGAQKSHSPHGSPSERHLWDRWRAPSHRCSSPAPGRCSPSGHPAPARASARRHLPLPAALRAATPSATARAGHSCAVRGKGLISPLNAFPTARRWGRAHARCHGCRRSTQKVAGEGRGEGAEPPAGAECPPGAALRARWQLLSPRRLSRPPAAYGWRRGRDGGKA